MDLINAKVEHVRFGAGVIIRQEENVLTVQFSEAYGTKRFLYPDAFEKYLRICEPEFEAPVLEELRVKLAQTETEMAEKHRQYEEEAARIAIEKAALAAQKRKSAQRAKSPKTRV